MAPTCPTTGGAEEGEGVIQSGMIELSPGTMVNPLTGTAGNWTLNSGQGQRTFKTWDIQFPQPFTQTPTVRVSLAGIDADGQFNTRLQLTTEDVQADEFNIRVTTWDDSIVYAVWVSWIAHDQS
jgi:hypothetical protein